MKTETIIFLTALFVFNLAAMYGYNKLSKNYIVPAAEKFNTAQYYSSEKFIIYEFRFPVWVPIVMAVFIVGLPPIGFVLNVLLTVWLVFLFFCGMYILTRARHFVEYPKFLKFLMKDF